MRNVSIYDLMTIGSIEYYYADVTVDNGNYIVIQDKYNHISISDNGIDWEIHSGMACKPSDGSLVRLVVSKEYLDIEELSPITYTIAYDITPFIVVQLEDSEGYPLTPYTSAKGVELNNGKDIETQINYMDESVISADEMSVLSSITVSADTAVNEVKAEGAEYRTDIDQLKGEVGKIDAQVFPLKINTSITPNFTTYLNVITVTITEYDTGKPDLTSETVWKFENGKSVLPPIYNKQSPDCTASFTIEEPIRKMKEEFKIRAISKSGKDKTVSEIRYLCFYGASSESSMTSDIALSLNKRLTTGVSFNPTITTEYGDYIWLIVPNYLSINKVKSAGFDVTLNEPESVNIGSFGTYKCYRTLNNLDEATWKLVIS